MNYRHAFHAGNHADVFKHALLVRLVKALQRKENGFLVLDTHAGRGWYDLERAAEGDTHAREPEWPAGIGRLWDEGAAPAEMADYLALVRDFDRSRGNLGPRPRFYPGSPWVARLLARPQDRLGLWEMHPDECAALRAEFQGERRVGVQEGDGYVGVRASLPPPERRALVLIDPPYESPNEWSEALGAVREGLRRHAAATVAVWYPLTARAKSDEFLAQVGGLGAPCLCAELLIDPLSEGLRGSGLAVVNPPWKVDGEAARIGDYLVARLGRAEGAAASVRWLLEE